MKPYTKLVQYNDIDYCSQCYNHSDNLVYFYDDKNHLTIICKDCLDSAMQMIEIHKETT